MYIVFDPPYFLFVVGLLAAITSGKAFEATLKQQVNLWSKQRSAKILEDLLGSQLVVPSLGICSGITVFLGTGLMIFGFPAKISFAMSVVLTIGTAVLLWVQLQKIFSILQTGGSQALDLDALDQRG